ncbi:MAG: [Fe] hydrogenase, HymD subunit [Candidatus Moranbacteria bacterium GW2011_GWC1_45_18]|nr:MAG: [Fe] hydrogenase, HymD subunit [Candidatus Moranbacteria bacterium GW2011_GWC2_40_12]KKT33982.1 MAG: [Fe] hydrogenase, HymD subunit [Candidatus Moranbacteria bacterium GW2011_GWF2_44_10]KKT70365.1 MAG: [Fe] hydrogenase, HymD subunit [Candidatus Moranbacteria bacterium GW2011_GWF1_44_4]KKT99352.1 MAG: [Fe] hydrogenase, HymD subunit [Candidatus Moranbacteria bacterium GW2011_GWC1_45_18]OGI24141.1 MAG: hypothetical protein A2194_04075 [Candidatus Moranbacteria bacterium RIFOXYA1_FULL_44_8]
MIENNNTKTIATTFPLATYQTKDIAWTIAFIIAAVIFPALLAHTPQNQWVTGTIINAILFLAVWRVGFVNAALVAALPSSIALLRGLLPAPMAVLIPYIILSNIIMIAIFYSARKTDLETKFPSLMFAVSFASLLKFAFLFAITSYFLKVSSPLLVMMHWPQLFTALAGGLIAVGIMKILK